VMPDMGARITGFESTTVPTTRGSTRQRVVKFDTWADLHIN
jgi:hypothetical protein